MVSWIEHLENLHSLLFLKKAGLFSLLLALAVPAVSDDGGGVLEEIIVTATRIPTGLVSLPFAAGSVGRDEIQRGRQQLGLDEALVAVPGLFFQNRYNFAQDLRIEIGRAHV